MSDDEHKRMKLKSCLRRKPTNNLDVVNEEKEDLPKRQNNINFNCIDFVFPNKATDFILDEDIEVSKKKSKTSFSYSSSGNNSDEQTRKSSSFTYAKRRSTSNHEKHLQEICATLYQSINILTFTNIKRRYSEPDLENNLKEAVLPSYIKLNVIKLNQLAFKKKNKKIRDITLGKNSSYAFDDMDVYCDKKSSRKRLNNILFDEMQDFHKNYLEESSISESFNLNNNNNNINEISLNNIKDPKIDEYQKLYDENVLSQLFYSRRVSSIYNKSSSSNNNATANINKLSTSSFNIVNYSNNTNSLQLSNHKNKRKQTSNNENQSNKNFNISQISAIKTNLPNNNSMNNESNYNKDNLPVNVNSCVSKENKDLDTYYINFKNYSNANEKITQEIESMIISKDSVNETTVDNELQVKDNNHLSDQNKGEVICKVDLRSQFFKDQSLISSNKDIPEKNTQENILNYLSIINPQENLDISTKMINTTEKTTTNDNDFAASYLKQSQNNISDKSFSNKDSNIISLDNIIKERESPIENNDIKSQHLNIIPNPIIQQQESQEEQDKINETLMFKLNSNFVTLDNKIANEKTENIEKNDFLSILEYLTQTDNPVLFLKTISKIGSLSENDEFYGSLKEISVSSHHKIISNIEQKLKKVFQKKKTLKFLIQYYKIINSIVLINDDKRIMIHELESIDNQETLTTTKSLSFDLLNRMNFELILNVQSYPLIIYLLKELLTHEHRKLVYKKFNNSSIWLRLANDKNGKQLIEFFLESYLLNKEFKKEHLGDSLLRLLQDNLISLSLGDYSTYVIQSLIKIHNNNEIFNLIITNIDKLAINRNGVFVLISYVEYYEKLRKSVKNEEELNNVKYHSEELMIKVLSNSKSYCKQKNASTLIEVVLNSYENVAIEYFIDVNQEHFLEIIEDYVGNFIIQKLVKKLELSNSNDSHNCELYYRLINLLKKNIKDIKKKNIKVKWENIISNSLFNYNKKLGSEGKVRVKHSFPNAKNTNIPKFSEIMSEEYIRNSSYKNSNKSDSNCCDSYKYYNKNNISMSIYNKYENNENDNKNFKSNIPTNTNHTEDLMIKKVTDKTVVKKPKINSKTLNNNLSNKNIKQFPHNKVKNIDLTTLLKEEEEANTIKIPNINNKKPSLKSFEGNSYYTNNTNNDVNEESKKSKSTMNAMSYLNSNTQQSNINFNNINYLTMNTNVSQYGYPIFPNFMSSNNILGNNQSNFNYNYNRPYNTNFSYQNDLAHQRNSNYYANQNMYPNNTMNNYNTVNVNNVQLNPNERLSFPQQNIMSNINPTFFYMNPSTNSLENPNKTASGNN